MRPELAEPMALGHSCCWATHVGFSISVPKVAAARGSRIEASQGGFRGRARPVQAWQEKGRKGGGAEVVGKDGGTQLWKRAMSEREKDMCEKTSHSASEVEAEAEVEVRGRRVLRV